MTLLRSHVFHHGPFWRRRTMVVGQTHSARFLCGNVAPLSTKTILTPVVIVGGGPSGLLLSNLLSSYQVPSVLIEGQSVEERCKHPQAHFLNTRTMQILRQLPRVHRRIQDQMTPVEQWKYFQFGYNMLPETALARVDHPVDKPLSANVDANGTLMEENEHHNSPPAATRSVSQPASSSSRPLSACSVGHLAQHTFCRILYEAAQEEALPEDTQLHYSTQVTKLTSNANTIGFEIETNANLRVQAPVCIAADGAHSFCRNEWKIDQVGQVGIQHLINIHVKTCPEWARSYLHDQGRNFAMLYSTFHPNIVSMIVCHSIGEYVFQVPYFPPYQTLEDFTPQRVQQMIHDAMGMCNDDTIHKKNAQIIVVSVKAWTMSSLIAERYFHTTPGGGVGILVGDAGHVFPPAGGLGMNTGIQDVYSLAWKLAWAYHHGHLSFDKTSSSEETRSVVAAMGATYENERRPVAQSNAALSVRNYNRVLGITKAFYLNEQHPALLIQALEASSALVPFEVRRDIFQRLYATATWTLSSLRDPHHPYTKHLRQNLRRILGRGGGLPLLFPQAELGFGYTDSTKSDVHGRPSKEDTMGFYPAIRVGHLFPHVEGTVVNSPISNAFETFSNLKPLMDGSQRAMSISLSDLPAQVSRDTKPCFVLLWVVVDSCNDSHLETGDYYLEAAINLSKKLGMTVELVEVRSASALPAPTSATRESSEHLVVREVPHPPEGSLLDGYGDSLWLIRPDGHIAGGVRRDKVADMESTTELMNQVLVQCAYQALFGRR